MESSTAEQTGQGQPPARGGTERALAVLKELAAHPEGATLDELARGLGTPKSSVHRALAALVRAELAVHPEPGRYVLGTEFVRLAYAHNEEREEPRLVEPCLRELADTFEETAHYAELDGTEVIYMAKVTPRNRSVQMTSTIGGRNPAYCTGVGKALLASRLQAADDAGAFVAGLGPLVARTEHTLCRPDALIADLRATAERGYSVDDQESEIGINCVAFPLFRASPRIASGAVSVAALRHRMPLDELRQRTEEMREIIHRHLGRVTW